jgi:3D-(3,5/4)-trihydroxycyclohexane-1,2-dione acylhydrolase (decyclizing)
MMAQEIVTSIQEGLKLTIVLVDNYGYASIGALSRSTGTEGFGTRYLLRSSRDSLGDEAAAGDQPLPVDLALNAEGLGAQVLRARDLEEFRDALVTARSTERTVVIHVPADRYEGVPSYDSWWDVPVSEVSESQPVRQAREAYERAGADRRWYVAPSEDPL